MKNYEMDKIKFSAATTTTWEYILPHDVTDL